METYPYLNPFLLEAESQLTILNSSIENLIFRLSRQDSENTSRTNTPIWKPAGLRLFALARRLADDPVQCGLLRGGQRAAGEMGDEMAALAGE